MVFHRNATAYAATILAYSMMHSVYYFYYVKLFLDKYHIVFLLWNTLNDPLFGYFQDNSSWDIFKHRSKSILYGAPIYALTFLLPWFQISSGDWITGLHFMFSLCAYDTLFTFVLLAECALFAEMSQVHEERLRLIKYSQIASVIGSTTVFLSNAISNNMQEIHRLQVFCVIIAILAWLCMRYTGLNAKPDFVKSDDMESGKNKASEGSLSITAAWAITKQILFNENFLAFGIMNCFQELHVYFLRSFLIIFGDNLIPVDAMVPMMRSLLYGASFFVPQVVVLLSGGVIHKIGYFRVFMICFMSQIIASMTMYIIGRHHYTILALFLLFDLTITSAASCMINLPLSDIVDEDREKHSIGKPRSAMVFATNALVTKPSQSIAPMAVVFFLNKYGYKQLKDAYLNTSNVNRISLDALHDAMFVALCGLPLIVCTLQMFIWSNYKLRDTHTSKPKYIEM